MSLATGLSLICGLTILGGNVARSRGGMLAPVAAAGPTALLQSGKAADPLMDELPAKERCAAPVMRTITETGFLYEDFEDMQPLHLSGGWVALATPGLPDDTWNVATLGSGDNTVHGVSGEQYAFILGNRDSSNPIPHDAWLFSPKVKLEANVAYDLEFFTYMPPGNNVGEDLEVYITSGTSPDSKIVKLGDVSDATPEWKQNQYKFTPGSDGEYCLAFHSVSKAMSNATLIDDVRISSGDIPGFYGAIGVTFGKTDLVAGTFTAEYKIGNTGTAPLEIGYVSASPEISVKDLPVTIPPRESRVVEIEFTPSAVGSYQGQYVLSTNDPRHPTVELIAISDVLDVPVTAFTVEDFEAGGPKGWILPLGVVNTDYIPGHDGPRALYTRGFYSLDETEEIGFTSHYVDMGDNPTLEMWLKFISCDLMGKPRGPLGGDVPILHVLVSDNFGEYWDEVWTMEPGGENAHTGTEDFFPVKIDLSKYAGKRCRVKTVIGNAKSIEDDFIFLTDDVAIGTRPDVDMKVSGLTGAGSVRVDSYNELSVTVQNLGKSTSDYYEVSLVDGNGRVLDTVGGYDLDAGAKKTLKLHWEPMIEGPVDLYAVVDADGDDISDNDRSNLLGAIVLDAESEIAIDDSPQRYIANIPFNFRAYETAVQTIYYANELGIDAGYITALNFTSLFDVDHLTDNVEVFVAETDRKDFADNSWIPDSEFTKVFEGQFYLPGGQREFAVPFTAPYKYSGGNLVVMTRKLSDSAIGTKGFIVHESDAKRTIESVSTVKGALVKEGYGNRESFNLFAHVTVDMIKPETGRVTGKVRDAEKDIDGAEVRLEGTQLCTATGGDGRFSFPEIKEGSRKFTATKYGYYPSEGNVAEVAAGGEAVMDIVLNPYPARRLSGTVSDTEGNPVAGAKVVLEGYASYSALTDDKGHYEIDGVYADTGTPYDLRIETLYYNTLRDHNVVINDDATYDATLKAESLRPFRPEVSEEDGTAVISWEEPVAEFSYDDGKPVTYLGWPHGHSKTAIFSTYHQKINVREIRFFITDSQGPHANVNLLIFPLNSEGRPDTSNPVWSATAVPFNDNAWTSYYLDSPVTVENFAIAISCDGYLGLGATASDAGHPFAEKMHFFAGDNYTLDWDIMDFTVFAEYHPMLRVGGDYLGNPATDPYRLSAPALEVSRPYVEYDVYRYDADMSQGSKVKLATTVASEYRDETFADLRDGRYNYSVAARYADGKSDEVFAAIVKNQGGIGSMESDVMTIVYNASDRSLRIGDPAAADHIALYSIDGVMVERIDGVKDVNHLSSLQPGAYIVAVVCNDGSIVSKKIMVH